MKSELFIECAKSVVDFYNLTQETIGSKNRMEYPVVKEVKPREWNMVLHENKLYRLFECGGEDTKVIKVRECFDE